MQCAALLLAVTIVQAGPAEEQAPTGTLFGSALCVVADLDGDGVRDLAVGDPYRDGWTGAVTYLSGRSGAVLREEVGERRGARFGGALASAAAHGDPGSTRWAVAAYGSRGTRGHVDLFEGVAVKRTQRFEPQEDEEVFGAMLALVPASATQGAVLAATTRTSGATAQHRLRAWSLDDGAELWSRDLGDAGGPAPIGLVPVVAHGPESFLVGLPTEARRWMLTRFEARTAEVLAAPAPKRESRTPGCFAALEVDGDDVLDLVVGFPGERSSSDGTDTLGFARVLSGAASHVLWTRPSACVGYGANVAAAGDVDGDGRDDYLLATYDVLDHGRVSLHSGARGRTLHTWDADAERTRWQRFGIALCAVDDLDGDGVRDVAIGSTNPFAPGEGGSVWAYSSASGALLWSVER